MLLIVSLHACCINTSLLHLWEAAWGSCAAHLRNGRATGVTLGNPPRMGVRVPVFSISFQSSSVFLLLPASVLKPRVQTRLASGPHAAAHSIGLGLRCSRVSESGPLPCSPEQGSARSLPLRVHKPLQTSPASPRLLRAPCGLQGCGVPSLRCSRKKPPGSEARQP